MERYCVIGNPVEHSRSPWIHARFAALTQQSLRYDRCLAPLDGFARSVQTFREQAERAGEPAGGCNITVPFKFEAAALATECTARAQLAGAVNTLRFEADGRILGDNTDGAGLVHDITVNAGRPLAGTDVLLIGAGGASAGVLGPLLSSAPRRLILCNRTLAKAQALVQSHAALADQHQVQLQASALHEVEGDFDVVINGSASSLTGAQVPIHAGVLRTGALAIDMMYGPAAAPFLQWAQQHGAQARDGLGMLVEQAAEAFALWRGVRPPAAQVLSELRQLVDASA